MNPDFGSMMAEIQRAYNAELESILQRAVISIEGKIPSHEQISQHGKRVIYPDGKTEYHWKDMVILTINPKNIWDGHN